MKDRLKAKFQEILEIVGYNDPKVAERLASLYQDHIFRNEPLSLCIQEERGASGALVVERGISFISFCEHHLVPMIGKVTIGYIVKNKVMGLSSIHQVVKYFAAKPQIQERLMMDVVNEMSERLETEDIAISIKALQTCVLLKGHSDAETTTYHFGGKFKESEALTKEFFVPVPVCVPVPD